MDVRNNNVSPSFGCFKLRIPFNEYAAKEGSDALTKINKVREAVNDCRFWHIIADKDGYKIESAVTEKVYEIEHKPKRPKCNSLYIRTVNPNHKVKGKITSFKVDLGSEEEAKDLYKKIITATGIDKFIIIVKALNEQVVRRNVLKKAKRCNAEGIK